VNVQDADLSHTCRCGTQVAGAHRAAHEVQGEIGARLPRADFLIHHEPEDRVRPGAML